jgi:hypothetical protein
MSALTEGNVPRRMACLVMMPNQVSIWLSQLDPIGVKCKVTFGLRTNQALTSGGVVGGQIVEHDVDLLAGMRFHGFAEERQKRGGVTAGVALGRDLSGGHVVSGEEVGHAVALVVVGAFLGQPEIDRQERLGAVQRLIIRGRWS